MIEFRKFRTTYNKLHQPSIFSIAFPKFRLIMPILCVSSPTIGSIVLGDLLPSYALGFRWNRTIRSVLRHQLENIQSPIKEHRANKRASNTRKQTSLAKNVGFVTQCADPRQFWYGKPPWRPAYLLLWLRLRESLSMRVFKAKTYPLGILPSRPERKRKPSRITLMDWLTNYNSSTC